MARFTVHTDQAGAGITVLPSSRDCECPQQVDIHLGLLPPRDEDEVDVKRLLNGVAFVVAVYRKQTFQRISRRRRDVARRPVAVVWFHRPALWMFGGRRGNSEVGPDRCVLTSKR